MLRAFIAIELPHQVKEKIAAQTAGLRRKFGHSLRWVTADNLHLTLKFLGEIASIQIDPLAQALETESKQHQPFEITIEGLGCFPNPRRPRVVWVGIVAPPALPRLVERIETAIGPLGFAAEERPFSAHLTIGRVREQLSAADLLSISETLQDTPIGRLGTFTAATVHLFRSDLQPGGPVYRSLSTSALGGKPIHEVKPEST